MNRLLLFFCASVLGFSVPAISKPHYVITVPAQMQPSTLERACVTFISIARPLSVHLELRRGDRVHVLAEDTMSILNYSQCFPFQVPVLDEDEEQVWFFHSLVQGDDINFNQTKKVLITRGNQLTFIQTDKPFYKPGQTVKFRVVTLDNSLRASEDQYPVVELQDPHKNCIGQWQNVSPVNGIADFTFPLAEELTLGEYKISIPNKLVKSFTVSEYVLKRFEVLINAPSRISQKDESFTMKACGRYNYGKSVMGSLNIEICRQIVTPWSYFFHEDEDTASESCQVLPSVQTDSTGCVSKVIDLHSLISENSDYDQQLAISCSLTEHNTGQMEKATARVTIGNRQTIEFVDIESYYYKGVPFTGRIKVEDERGNPKKNERVYLELISDDTNSTMSLLTDELGIARFTLETSEWDDMVSLTGKFSLDGNDEGDVEDLMAYKWLSRFYSESSSFLKVESIAEQLECDSEQSIRVDYFLNNKHLDPQSERLSFFYIILANGRIIHHGEYRLNVLEQKSAPTLQSSFYLVIPVTNDLLSEATVLVFTVLMNGEMIAGQERYTISSCFKNKVTLEFSEKRVRPGRKVNLEIKAESGSVCSVRSVDNGLLLHQSQGRTGKSSTLDNLMARIGKMNMFGFPYINEDLEEYPCLETEALDQTQERHPWFHSAADVYSLFKDSGLKVFTNTKIKMPVSCLTPEFTMRSSKSMQQNNKDADVPLVSTSEERSEKVRAFFPDTWLYELVPIGPNGLAVLNLTTPDSITSWKTDAFCLGKSGFGETYGTALTTFKPYFIDLMLPYSIIQGEELTLTAIVFSYVKHCVMAVVSLSDSLDFTVTQGARKQFSCICADQTATFTWNITATKPGTIKIHVRSSAVKQEGGCTTKDFDQRKKQKLDALVKSIIVKPSGILNEFAETFLLCPSGNSLHEDISLQIPDDVVPGSEHASVTVHGDIMGKAINNVGHLLKLPFGCGEQNIAIFATNIYIMQYLQSTNQLKPEFKKHASMYLMTGYQRQLLFKHDDGSYSAFGKRDLQGNAWLTAFVLRSFGQAREYIYIEEKNIQASVRWLSSLQMPNGCFRSIGTPFHNRLKSGVEDDVTFAAYITIALLESGTAFNESIAHNALRCLKSHVDVTNTYSQALLAYVFTLSGDGDLRHHMLTVLEKKAISGGGAKHWALDPYGNGGVEVSSYVLLALLSAKIHFMKDFAAATNIVSWIIKQQNPWGGFYSTQDTVVALYALSKYAKVIFTESDEVKVKIRSPLGFQFAVDKSKGLLVQSASMPHIPGKYTVTATGRGCVYVQTHLRYHTRPRKLDTHFALRVRTRPALCSSEVEGSFEVLVEVSYVGNRISTNMVIVEVELLSGFISVDESIKKLQNNPLIKRTEVSAEKVTIYLEELKHQTEDFSFFIKQESLVRNLQPAHVHVYDYYNPGEHSKAEYTAPCSSG